MQKTIVNQKHKDRLFLRLFQEKQTLLSLYNAVNRSNYSDPDLLEITTLENVLYIGIKNDVSFLIDNCMNLYEAQSSWNPNMPLRGLFYFSRLYSSYVESRQPCLSRPPFKSVTIRSRLPAWNASPLL